MPVASKPSAAQASTTSATFADLPEFAPELVSQPGGVETNAAYQEWWTEVRYQLLQLQNGTQQGLIKLKADAQGSTGDLQAQITHEENVRAAADSALATSITTVEATLTSDISAVAASVVVEASARATADGHLEGKYTLQVTAGNVVTGMNITSSTGGGQDISTVIFQANDFLIYNGSNGIPVFAASAGVVTLGATLTINQASSKVYIGTGTYGASNTQFYVDSSGNFSLGSKLTWNGTTLSITGTLVATAGTIGGWTINTSTITGGSATLDSAGQLILGTTNNIVYLSATDATYRLWVGNATAGSATFRVTKAGALTATSGTVGGWTLGSTTFTGGNATLDSTGQLILGTGNSVVYASATDSTYRLWVGNATSGSATFRVTSGGAMTALAGNIGGWTIGSTTLSGGSVTLDSSGAVYGGATNYATGNGFWLGNSGGGTFKFYVGNAGTGVLFDGTTTFFGNATTAVAINATGLNVGTTGAITGGQTTYNTGSGFFLGYNSGAHKFSIGDGSHNSLAWDGTTLNLVVTGSVKINNGTSDVIKLIVSGGGGGVQVLDPSYSGDASQLNPGFLTIIQNTSTAGTIGNVFFGNNQAFTGMTIGSLTVVATTYPGIRMGSGDAEQDITIYRSAAHTITTDACIQSVTATSQPSAIITGPHAGAVDTNYALTVIHRNNTTTKYGLLVGTNWAAVENLIFTVATIDASSGGQTYRFNVYGDGSAWFHVGLAIGDAAAGASKGQLTVRNSSASVNSSIICGSGAYGAVQTNYGLTVINSTDTANNWGLFVGIGHNTTTDKIFTAALINESNGVIVERFNVYSDGTVAFGTYTAGAVAQGGSIQMKTLDGTTRTVLCA